MKKPSKFKSIILPNLICTVVIFVVTFSFLIQIFKDGMFIEALVISIISSITFLIFGIPFIKDDYYRYKENLHNWKYHQMTIDEYLKENYEQTSSKEEKKLSQITRRISSRLRIRS